MKKGLIAVLVLAVAAGAWFFSRGKGAGPSEPAGLALTAPAERRDLEIAVEAAGLVEPLRVVEVKSKASGEVLKVLVDTGDVVEKGTLLSEIDPRDVQSALEQAQADLESVRVRAQLVRNQTALRLATERRGDVTIRAPISGTVLSRSVQPGQIIASATSNVSGGTAMFTMADLSQMQVRAKVSEADIGRIVPGLQARLSVEAYPGRTFSGQVQKVEPQAVVEQNVTMFPVLIRVDNKAGLLRPGMNSEVQLEVARRQRAVAVPSAAVVALRDARERAGGVVPGAGGARTGGGGRR